jgi:hypothetical protein
MLIRHIKLLFLSIKQLGLITGWKYFSCYLRALKDPLFVSQWADACEQHARKLEFFNPDDPVAEAARHWAHILRTCQQRAEKSN